MTPTKNNSKTIERPPVIAIMGHVDHGKSTLLDYIRKTNIVDTEAGGITQRISAYEVTHKGQDNKEHRITFLDTPGHEAFTAIRTRGAKVADIAILVIAADDGVKPQTAEALKIILAAKIPYIVALNKVDKPGVDLDWAKSNLAEHEIYVEGFGGDVPVVPISAKTGQGVPELLDMMILVAQLEELTGDHSKPAEGVIIEANLDKKRGISASIIIKDGTLKTGSFISAGTAYAPVRILENFLGKPLKEATFSSPVRIVGWNELPLVGSTIRFFTSKKDVEQYIQEQKTDDKKESQKQETESTEMAIIPILLKASEVGSLEALDHELKKIKNEKIHIRVIQRGVGDITENDVKLASARPNTIILGFNVKIDNSGKSQAEKMGIEVQIFDIIYKLSEWLQKTADERTPRTKVEEPTGTAKVLKIFSRVKDRQVLGGRVEKGQLVLGAEVKILRRDFEIGRGRIRELQRQKNKIQEVPEGQEFGSLVESKIEIAPGDRLESFKIVEK
ncbi:translation initiation factor IF-2 [Candidatus Parcubacteria bacterium]|nr:translation initiation factor IF-2 [Candidatus Parcubacteria bacterium]